jgi:exodeoxyribonuclease VII small subunit
LAGAQARGIFKIRLSFDCYNLQTVPRSFAARAFAEQGNLMSEAKSVDELSFEEALAELEQLANAMAAGRMTLKESVSGYERGMALLKRCRRELEAARATIEKLSEEEGGAASQGAGVYAADPVDPDDPF